MAARQLLKSERLGAELADQIRSGHLRNGHRLPGEHTLARRYEVSRNTVRQALSGLQREGLIATAPGAGSFVTYDGLAIDEQTSWSWSRALGSVKVAAVLRFEVVRDGRLAEILDLGSDRFIALDRVRATEDGSRVTLERSRLPERPQLQGLVADGLRGGSLALSLVAAGVVPHHGDETAEVVALSDEDAATLARPSGAPFLRLTSTVADRDDRLIEHVVSLLAPEHFRLHRRVSPHSE